MAEQNYQVIVEHGRKAPIWNHYNMVMLPDGTKKAQCKRCGDLLEAAAKRHHESSCKKLKSGDDPNQPILDNSGQIWSYDAALAQEMQMKCVIQVGLPFGHFENPHITNMIKLSLQPRYVGSVSRQTLRRDAIKLWKMAKKDTRQTFLSLPNNVSLTCDIWSAPFGLPQSYICITTHWIVPQS
ncbi:hypothetical protein L6452_25604 [Arctium lappa]|uniref:Uncharacterized protein n=1 Tax=Arctium lappa TaxID=4217 RepID=A0ACB9AB90_ARCLA|nr:hypothetical protein L6452_25604 [Arctium lappa]